MLRGSSRKKKIQQQQQQQQQKSNEKKENDYNNKNQQKNVESQQSNNNNNNSSMNHKQNENNDNTNLNTKVKKKDNLKSSNRNYDTNNNNNNSMGKTSPITVGKSTSSGRFSPIVGSKYSINSRSSANSNNTNNNNNNNNNINNNNSNNTNQNNQSLQELSNSKTMPLLEQSTNELAPPPKKLERSNSFFLTRKLSKLYNTLTGSKENLNKIPEHDEPSPPTFLRSRTLSSISLRKSYRRSLRESKLEQLSEESVADNTNQDQDDTIKGNKSNGIQKLDGNSTTTTTTMPAMTNSTITNSTMPMTTTKTNSSKDQTKSTSKNNDNNINNTINNNNSNSNNNTESIKTSPHKFFVKSKSFLEPDKPLKKKYERRNSKVSITTPSTKNDDEDQHKQQQWSDGDDDDDDESRFTGLLSSLKRTFSLTPEKRKTMNPKWSASLISLQQIDIMVSYEDLSFINYDKFNTYERNLEKSISQSDLNHRHSIPAAGSIRSGLPTQTQMNNNTNNNPYKMDHINRQYSIDENALKYNAENGYDNDGFVRKRNKDNLPSRRRFSNFETTIWNHTNTINNNNINNFNINNKHLVNDYEDDDSLIEAINSKNLVRKRLKKNSFTTASSHASHGSSRRESNALPMDGGGIPGSTDQKFNSNLDANFDVPRNLYRQSLDDRKLRFLNKVNRESFRLSNNIERNPEDILMLENYLKSGEQSGDDFDDEIEIYNRNNNDGGNSIKHRQKQQQEQHLYPLNNSRTNSKLYFKRPIQSMCDIRTTMKIVLPLKSKSLTHLDALESDIAVQTESTSSPKPKSDANLDGLEKRNNKICCLSSLVFQSTLPTSLACTSNKNKKKSKSPSSSASSPRSPSSPSTITIKTTTTPTTTTTTPTSLILPSNNNTKSILLTNKCEVSSTAYVRVYFDLENAQYKDKEEYIPVQKGMTLADALHGALIRRNLSFSQITISDNNFPNSMDLDTPPYSGGINQYTDVENFAGKSIIITEKDNNKKSGHYSLQKAASFGSRSRPAKLFQSASTEETTTEHNNINDPKLSLGKQPKQRWSVLFGLKNPQQNHLCEILNHYGKNGVPQLHLNYTFENPNVSRALQYLENIHKSWTEFVHSSDLSESDNKIQSVIWELVTTEVDYIHALQTVTDLFLACLESIQTENLLKDIDQNKLFSNIRDICEANIKFWAMYLFPMVEHSIKTGHPMCIDYFQSGFITFATTFAPYKIYCAEQSTCQFYCKELNRNNTLFTSYLAWCESQKKCNRLRLADILVRPMQRLTKYSLLLIAIKKHITDENDGEIMDSMIHSVENFVCSVNSHLTTRQENERLKGIMARIESYDVVDSNNEHLDKMFKQYSLMFDLCGPMKGCAITQGRHLFMEGDLKFKDNINKLDVHCFLLTDILLVCKTIAKKGLGTLKVIRQPFMTDRLVIKVKENTLYSVYLNEYNVAVNAFTLQCPEAKSWHDAITKAKHIYSKLKQGSSWDGYNMKYSNTNINNINHNIHHNNHLNNVNIPNSQIQTDNLGVRKSPLNSSIGSRVSSLNNSHSGSVELTDSRNISVDYEKTNSLSSDEGASGAGGMIGIQMKKVPQNSPTKYKGLMYGSSGSNTLNVQPLNNLGQSLPNLNLHSSHFTNNTLLVPGTSSNVAVVHSTNLLSPSHRGISYPPPSPTRATLRRGFAFSASIKNPPLLKTRNITSQNSFNIIPAFVHQQSQIPISQISPSTSQHQLHTSVTAAHQQSILNQQQQQQLQAQQQQQQQQQLQQELQENFEKNLQNSNESDV